MWKINQVDGFGDLNVYADNHIRMYIEEITFILNWELDCIIMEEEFRQRIVSRLVAQGLSQPLVKVSVLNQRHHRIKIDDLVFDAVDN